MRYMTYLDYEVLENTGKTIESKLEEKDKEIAYLRERDTIKEDTINTLSDKLVAITSRLKELEKHLERTDRLEKELGII